MNDSLPLDDTIAALASAPGPAVRGIIRVSGCDTRDVLSRLFLPDDAAQWESVTQPWRHPGRVTLPNVHIPLTVDVLLWPTSRSYTGEPLAEVHTIGSPPLLEALLSVLYEQGARPAERGEFTLRAFLAGRIDLLQAEAVLGVIDATDQQRLNVALGQLGGGLSNQIAVLHEELLLHLADLEAGLDFVEEDIEFVSRDVLQQRLSDGIVFLEELTAQSTSRLQSTGRLRVVLAGLPNAGKSTLFNALVGDDRAIISQVAGTTRDYLRAPADWDGVAIELIDTAGWDSTVSGIAGTAGQLRQEQWDRADLIVWCTAADLSETERAVDDRLRESLASANKPIQEIITKGDMLVGCRDGSRPAERLVISAVTGYGLDGLQQSVVQQLQAQSADDRLLGSTAARCRDSLSGALSSLSQAQEAAETGAGDELIAIELREAIDHLGKVVGRVYTDDVLDRIFSRFCIGK